jgi:hypothetical protein
MTLKSTKKVTLALGVASVATSLGNVAVQAGPALQTLNNLTNSAEFTINNTYGQSFSVDGILASSVTPFVVGAAGDMEQFTASTASLTTNFNGNAFGLAFNAVTAVQARVATPLLLVVPVTLNQAGLADITLTSTGTQTIGASISSTLFGPSTVKATSSFTNQLINDLSAF